MPTSKRRAQSVESELKRRKLDQRSLPAEISEAPRRSSRASCQKRALVDPHSKKKSIVRSRQGDNTSAIRQSSRLKKTQKCGIRNKTTKTANANLHRTKSRTSGDNVDEQNPKAKGREPIQRKRARRKTSRAKVNDGVVYKCPGRPSNGVGNHSRKLPPDSKETDISVRLESTGLQLTLDLIQIDHNYGKPPKLSSIKYKTGKKIVSSPEKPPEMLQEYAKSTDQASKEGSATGHSNGCVDSAAEILEKEPPPASFVPSDKADMTSDGKQCGTTDCPQPLEKAVSEAVKESILVENTLSAETVSETTVITIENECCASEPLEKTNDSVLAEECAYAPEAPMSGDVEDVEIEHCIVEVVSENPSPLGDSKQKTPVQNCGNHASNLKSSSGPPKKQAMNPQARTKARLAAQAEEKAAASKRAAAKQLNLLALCEEIADDIASDTTVAKQEKDEPKSPGATMSDEKIEVSETQKEACMSEELQTTPASDSPEEQSPSPVPTQTPTDTQPDAEAPKRRFFLSQVTVPLKVHEKKKLSRYQRLRQVELQRDKLTWTQMKKLKSDQASLNQSTTVSMPSPAPAPVATPAPVTAPTTSVTPVTATTPTQSSNTESLQKSTLKTESKKVLPALPPPRPNGVTVPKTKPSIEYKPYTPRPKYSPDDFELDGVDEEVYRPSVPSNGKEETSARQTSSTQSERHSGGIVEKQPVVQTPADKIIPNTQGKDVKTPASSKSPAGNTAQGNCAPVSDACLQKEIKVLNESNKGAQQTTIDAGQKHFGTVVCSVCGMLYSTTSPEDESQHLLFHNQFISAVRYVGWKKERILGEYPDGKIILVLPDDPKYALKKVEEIREMVDNDLGFQQVETKCQSQTKTFLFISNDKKVAGCLIAEHIQEGYRVIEDPVPEGSEGEKVMFERQRAWCCSTTPEPALCGISRIWVFSLMRRKGIASRMIECLRNNFIYGSHLSKDEIAFSDPTPDGKLFATHYCGTSQFLVYNFVSGSRST
ncbi:N-acetyltransferase ESCO1 isoform X2 [Denticeps clupeoides]|uniref:N-acetyltransferase ESCO1 isoform X2 n=1 Tax=Denticeps clupeoides TaxID=299321 RepID=UPI0010A2D518|nr:N-acetyltransferase ESCO1-like isoform X2 [Denticeps clupeoides]